jgi:exodeoxyribonuclease VII large subunit
MPANSTETRQREIYSVWQLNREVRELLESGLGRIWVEGEISNLARPPSGHLYFSLKDARAQVSCALFRNVASRLGFNPENGTQVLIRAEVSLYEARGNFQLIVSSMEEAGDGALRRAFEELKQRLFDAGLFDQEHKQPLPVLPACIGIVTSPRGAAVRDVLSVLKRRFPSIPVIIYPTLVQGETAAKQIVTALETAQRRQECDVLLLTRGGGSLEDLWPFNEEIVARAVHACRIPLVSAVGHEIDVVISDFAADQRAATPSAAAELLSPDQAEWQARLQQLQKRLASQIQQKLLQNSERLDWLTRRSVQTHPGRRLQQQFQRLDDLSLRLSRTWLHRYAQWQAVCSALYSRLKQQSPAQRLQQLESRAAQLAQRLNYCINIQLSKRREKLAVLSRALDSISPLATLQRGYSITLKQPEAVVIHAASQAHTGDMLETRLAKGTIISQVKEIKDL